MSNQPDLSTPDTVPVPNTWTSTESSRYAPKGSDSHPEELSKRWERALALTPEVIPVAPGIYHLNTNSGSQYVIDLDGYANGEERAVCECQDYRYRCAEDGVDCKHILAVKQFVKSGLLPPVESDPVDWLNSRLDELESALSMHTRVSDEGGEAVNQLESVISDLRVNPYCVEYRAVVERFHEVQGQDLN